MARGMSRAEARAIWLKHAVDPDRIPPSQLVMTRNALIKRTHPDVGGNLEETKLINAAYDVLRASSLDDASWQRWEQAQRERELKRRQWEQYQRDYNEQRERERRYQEAAKRVAQHRAEEAEGEKAPPDR